MDRLWQRYIFLWLKFANYEELVAKDIERTRSIYNKVLEIIPHKQFTFAKLWFVHLLHASRLFSVSVFLSTLSNQP
jgi:hypothetical protein